MTFYLKWTLYTQVQGLDCVQCFKNQITLILFRRDNPVCLVNQTTKSTRYFALNGVEDNNLSFNLRCDKHTRNYGTPCLSICLSIFLGQLIWRLYAIYLYSFTVGLYLKLKMSIKLRECAKFRSVHQTVDLNLINVKIWLQRSFFHIHSW